MDDSILNSVKYYLGLTPEYDPFDQQLLMCINTALVAMTQLGIGPKEGFTIRDDTSTWSEFLGEDKRMESVKLDVCIRVRLLFDPPANSTLTETLESQKNEIEWRLQSDINFPED